MAYITEQEFCDKLKISWRRLRIILVEHESPVYWVKRCGKRVYDRDEANSFVELIKVEREMNKENLKRRRRK